MNCLSEKELLIIEDDSSLQSVLQLVFDQEGYKVHTASNGSEGLNLLSAGLCPGLIFLDQMMPLMNGAEFLVEINKIPAFAKIPIVVFSATVKEMHLEGEIIYLPKPITIEEILKTAANYLS